MDKRIWFRVAGLAVVVLLIGGTIIGLTARNSSRAMISPMSQPASPSLVKAGTGPAITIKGYAFEPQTLTVKAGTTVVWTNSDIAKHNIVADEGAPAGGPTGPLFGQGQTYSYTFTSPGTYSYHCDPHPYMHGKVVVTP